MLPISAFSADDPNIPKSTKAKVQTAMTNHINKMVKINEGTYPILDPDTRKIVQLDFKKLHKGVVVKGSEGKYYISCADFTDKSGIKIDIDFLVSPNYEVVESLIHKKDGKRMDYGVH